MTHDAKLYFLLFNLDSCWSINYENNVKTRLLLRLYNGLHFKFEGHRHKFGGKYILLSDQHALCEIGYGCKVDTL